MAIANGEDLPREATVILYVKKNSQLPKDGGPCTGLDVDAFRCDPDGISVTWVEFFDGPPDQQLRDAAHALKGTLSFKKSGILARAKVGTIIDVMAAAQKDVVVQRDKVDGNDAHCLIKGIEPHEVATLLALSKAFDPNEFVPCPAIAGLI